MHWIVKNKNHKNKKKQKLSHRKTIKKKIQTINKASKRDLDSPKNKQPLITP